MVCLFLQPVSAPLEAGSNCPRPRSEGRLCLPVLSSPCKWEPGTLGGTRVLQLPTSTPAYVNKFSSTHLFEGLGSASERRGGFNHASSAGPNI